LVAPGDRQFDDPNRRADDLAGLTDQRLAPTDWSNGRAFTRAPL